MPMLNEMPPSTANQQPTTIASNNLNGVVSVKQQHQPPPRSGFVGNKPAILEKGPLRFVITDSPTDANLNAHVQELMKLNVKHVCRATDPSYSTEPLQKFGIMVHEMSFKDGDPPPDDVLEKWLTLVEQCFIATPSKTSKPKTKNSKPEETVQRLKDNERISVHCVAGLGRAPVLVAVALVEFCNMEPHDAVTFIRTERRGAINTKQLKWLESYVPRRKQNKAMSQCECIIS